MNIHNWPMGRIMQLPDCCFGRRFSVSVQTSGDNVASGWDISEVALPEKCVLWEVVFYSISIGMAAPVDYIRVALGDQLPLSAPMMDALEPLVPGLGITGPEPRLIHSISSPTIFHMRNPISAMGRRLVLEVRGMASTLGYAGVICEFSSVPTEAPDWLNLEHLRSP